MRPLPLGFSRSTDPLSFRPQQVTIEDRGPWPRGLCADDRPWLNPMNENEADLDTATTDAEVVRTEKKPVRKLNMYVNRTFSNPC